jgi:hypothetical protein
MEWRRMADALGLCAGGKLGHRLRIIFAGARGPHREPHCIDGSPAHCSSHVGEAPGHYGDVVGERGSRSRFDLWACPGLIYPEDWRDPRYFDDITPLIRSLGWLGMLRIALSGTFALRRIWFYLKSVVSFEEKN